MKWRYTIPAKPVVGDIKTERKFAFMPTKLDDGNKVWLEFYHINYQYEEKETKAIRIGHRMLFLDRAVKFNKWVLKSTSCI